MSGLARPELLATTDWLAEHLGRPGVRVLDARWRPDGSAAEVHRARRIAGSVHVDWRADLVEPDESGEALRLASADQVCAVAERAGIGDGSTVVIYDDTQGLYAARTWWTFRTYGLESVRILDGGFPAWEAEGRALARGTLDDAPSAPFTVPAGRFTPRGPNRMRLTTADVRGLLGAPDVTLLDARAPAEYRGFEGNTRRLGHIPGAINVPVGAMHQAGTQLLREGAELRDRLHAANVSRGRRMVTYDGSGVAAAKLAFILALLGHEDVAVYDGGWAEWGNRLDLPVDR
jgi:thiosulfate/3-mercaptopyruvate sulfurtransferase